MTTRTFLSTSGVRIRSDLSDVVYKPVEALDDIADEVGVPVTSLVKLNANENVYGTPQEVCDCIAAAFTNLHIYPNPTQMKLREAIASKLHGDIINVNQVVAGAGSDDILDIVVRLLGPQAIVISSPTFGMYEFLGRIAGAELVDVPRILPSFNVDVNAILDAVRSSMATLVFLPSPNNPTGNSLSQEDVRTLCEGCLPLGALVVIDEAYADFSELPSAAVLLNEYPNLMVTRTFSKWAGLAGLRVGYAMTDADLASRMMAIKQPYNINTAADAAARAAITQREIIMRTVRALVKERKRLENELKRFSWLRVCPSEANFLLCQVKTEAPFKAVELARLLRNRGILIRFFGKQGGDLENYIRISAGRLEHTDAVVAALDELYHEAKLSCNVICSLRNRCITTILFDMDGVLADVSRSYRAAIALTALHYGVKVSNKDISAAKSRGNANNDWVLSKTLIEAAGIEVGLQEVTDIFESYYQGTEEVPGLWESENLLVERSLMLCLAERYSLGIVTGRPRAPDAERFLAQHDLSDIFKVVICMEDAPPKPNPKPVQLALDALGVAGENAIMLGDTPDDIHAAAAASVLAIGVRGPGQSSLETKSLRLSGAETVLNVGLTALSLLLQD